MSIKDTKNGARNALEGKREWKGQCYEFTGARDTDGYGRTYYNGRMWMAHRLAWFSLHGEIPAGAMVCHRCDNPPCCNPAHLFLGSALDNEQDKMEKGRKPVGSALPFSKLTEEAVLEMKNSTEPARVFADKYGVDVTMIQQIRSGKWWKHVEGPQLDRKAFGYASSSRTHLELGTRPPKYQGDSHPNARFTDEQVLAIKRSPNTAPVLAEEYGTTVNQIHELRKKRSRPWLSVTVV